MFCGAASVGYQAVVLKGNTVNRLKLTSGVMLILGYAALVTAIYGIGRVYSDTPPFYVLFILTVPSSILVGLIIIYLSLSGYVFPLDNGLLIAAALNCLWFYFLKTRFSSRRNVERSDDNGDS
jgi:hypothetical protein